MGDKEHQFSYRTAYAAKAILRLNMIFVSPVQTLNHLLVWPVLLRLIVEVLQSDDVFQGQIELVMLGVDKVQTGLIRRIAIGDESDLLLFGSGFDGLDHCGDCRFCPAVVAKVVSGNFFRSRTDKQPDIVPERFDFDIGFITGNDVIDFTFVFEIEFVAIIGSRLDII